MDALLTLQISTNAMKPTRVTPTLPAPTVQVHMPATVPAVIREMERTVKLKIIQVLPFIMRVEWRGSNCSEL